jgi:hypothetical protein
LARSKIAAKHRIGRGIRTCSVGAFSKELRPAKRLLAQPDKDSMTPKTSASSREKFELAQKCLIAIRDIADRAVRSLDPEIMGYAVQELTQVLVERTGNDERLFEPVSVGQINDLPKLYAELDWVDGSSQDLVVSAAQRVV